VGGSRPKIDGELTEKQKAFVREYLVDFNGTQAAIRAGYAKNSASQEGSRLLANDKVSAYVRKAIDKRAKRTEITADNVLRELACIVFSDMREYVTFDNGGMVIKSSDDLTEEQTHCISEVSDCEFKGERKRSFKLHDKVKAIDMSLRHLGLYLDKHKVELDGKVSFSDVIKRAIEKDGSGDGSNTD